VALAHVNVPAVPRQYGVKGARVMTADELAAAVASCGFRCVECQSDAVRLDWSHLTGFVPVIRHWEIAPGVWCEATHGGAAAARVSLDLIDALAACVPVSDYGEPCWHRRAWADAA
jgi:hypothetical protein